MDQYEVGDTITVPSWKAMRSFFTFTVERITYPKRSELTPRKGQVVQRLHLNTVDKIDVLAKAA
jgi:hypothetical protein